MFRISIRDQFAQLAGAEGRGHLHGFLGTGQHLLHGFLRSHPNKTRQLADQRLHDRGIPAIQRCLADLRPEGHGFDRRIILAGRLMRQTDGVAQIPAFHQRQTQLTKAGAEQLHHHFILIDTGLSQGAGQIIRRITGAAPERQLTDVM